jgi:uncharacterized membrane protein YvbJ
MKHLYRIISLAVSVLILVPMTYASAIFNAILCTINNFTYHNYNEFEFPIENYKQAFENSNRSKFVWLMEYSYEKMPVLCKVVHLLLHPILFYLINAHNSVKNIYY